jgi:hypothetical protein
MRSVPIVMVSKRQQNTLEMPGIQDKQPIEALGANRPHELFGDPNGLRRTRPSVLGLTSDSRGRSAIHRQAMPEASPTASPRFSHFGRSYW